MEPPVPWYFCSRWRVSTRGRPLFFTSTSCLPFLATLFFFLDQTTLKECSTNLDWASLPFAHTPTFLSGMSQSRAFALSPKPIPCCDGASPARPPSYARPFPSLDRSNNGFLRVPFRPVFYQPLQQFAFAFFRSHEAGFFFFLIFP